MFGSYVALITPFDEKERIDWKALEALIEWHIAEGSDGIVCGATTGEGVALSDEERVCLAKECVSIASGRLKVIVSTGASSTWQAVKHTEEAQKAGADGCLVVTPFYNRPSQRGCIAHFKEVSKVGLPVIAYHNPGRAGIRLSLETVEELSGLVSAMKDSSHDEEFIGKICKKLPVFAGDDDMTLQTIRSGGVGCIGVVSNIIPRFWKEMVSFAMKGAWVEADGLFAKALPFIRVIFSETNPQGPKFAVSLLGKCKPVLRLPMMLPTEENRRAIQEQLGVLCKNALETTC